jgi:hypothetical protein
MSCAMSEDNTTVAVRGGDQSDVGPDRLVAADALERLLLEQAEDPGLEDRRHVADLVEEDKGPGSSISSLGIRAS